MSLTASNVVFADASLIEDMEYIVSRYPYIENDGVIYILRKHSHSDRVVYTEKEKRIATKLITDVAVDCMKYNYLNDKENRAVNKGQIKFTADLLRDDRHGDTFKGGESAKLAITSFLLSKYRGLSGEELKNNFREEYGFELGKFDMSSVIGKESIKNEYCQNNKKIMDQKLSDLVN